MKTNPQLTDLQLIKALETLHLKAGSWTAMVKSLDEITNLKHAELEIECVESKTQLTDWLRIVNNVLMGGNSVSSQLFGANLKNPRFQLFLGRFDGRPVATALALSENETCGVYLVSTHQDYQGQGIGRDMTLAAMTAGRKMKCEKAVLQAKASGHGVYQKLVCKTAEKLSCLIFQNISSHETKFSMAF